VMETPTAHKAVPFLRANEEQVAATRRQLEDMFRELRLVQDVIKVCGGACDSVSSDLDSEIENVLHRCGSDRLCTVMMTLTELVERFGGMTDMSGLGDLQ
jgi:hypothetical protein